MPLFPKKHLDLDLNGPTLSFTTNPTGVGSTGVGVGSTGGGSVSLTGIATYSFEGNSGADSDGSISYQWYEESVGAVSNGTYVTGAATTTLTLTNLITPTDNDRKFYLQADFVPGYTGPSTTYLTGNALNEPLNSGVGTVTVDPLLEITAQPSSIQALLNTDATITVVADLTDSSFIGAGLTYKWMLDGDFVDDGTITTTTTTSSSVAGTIENTYTSGAEGVSIPSSATDIEVTVAGAAGGSGGSDSGGPGGRGAQGRAGRFSLPDGAKDLTFVIGYRGNGGGSGGPNAFGNGGGVSISHGASGANGGGAGQHGWSGGGGGGGSASVVKNNGNTIIVSAGGGGGGGGSWNRGGDSGYNRNPGVGLGYDQGNVSQLAQGGSAGTTKNGDGGGGGGGGGGAPNGNGGGSGQDNAYGGYAGSGGASAVDPAQATLLGSNWLNDGDGYANLKYTGYTNTTVTTTKNVVVSGTTSKTLTIKSDIVGIHTAQCVVYHPDATNNPITSDEVSFVAVSSVDENNLMVEAVGVTDTATISSINLNNGEYTFTVESTDVDNNGINQFYSFYSPDKDMEVELDLYGGKGPDKDGNAGGEGGYSRIRFTMDRNTEYVITGLTAQLNTPFIYRKGTLIACVGQGGGAGNSGKGGFGGGVDVGGSSGTGGINGGQGGSANVTIGGNGIFGSKYTTPAADLQPGDTNTGQPQGGGQTIVCTKGVYWAQQGVGACTDISGSTQFRLSDGTVVSNTASLTRGFKAGYNIMQTAGQGGGSGTSATVGGDGGNGATGGWGAADGIAGGGGGSGYQDGSITVVDTQLGGSTSTAKVVLRVVT